jgi:sporulation protein YlmC with PRC-barrel domain
MQFSRATPSLIPGSPVWHATGLRFIQSVRKEIMLLLVHDILDKQVKDIDGANAGRVDGIVLELRDGAPPIVRYIEVSPITMLARISERLARWYARQDAKLRIDRGRPFRVPWQYVRPDGPTVTVDLDVEATPINALEDWLRVKIVERIPGS